MAKGAYFMKLKSDLVILKPSSPCGTEEVFTKLFPLLCNSHTFTIDGYWLVIGIE